jgi:dihydrofolate reductase
MRKVVLAMHTTLNGRLDDPVAWFVGLPDDLYTEIDRGYSTFDTILVGRVTYEEMAEHWPGAETDPDGSEINKRMARKMNTYRKYVFSTATRETPLTWNNAEPVVATSDRDLVAFVEDLKGRPGADIHLSGGARLAQTFVRLGLVDEYRFFVHPVVSKGAAWFDQLEDNTGMELVSAMPFENGVVGLYHRPGTLAPPPTDIGQ